MEPIIASGTDLTLGRRFAFCASHRVERPGLTTAANRELYGDDYTDGVLTPELVSQYQAKFKSVVHGLSETIDDFRSFFAPDEVAQSFDLVESVRHAVAIVEAGCRDVGIVRRAER